MGAVNNEHLVDSLGGALRNGANRYKPVQPEISSDSQPVRGSYGGEQIDQAFTTWRREMAPALGSRKGKKSIEKDPGVSFWEPQSGN